MMNASALDDIIDLSRRWEAACRSCVTDDIVGMLSDDAVVWYNYEGVEHDRDAYRATLDSSRTSFRNVQYRDVRVMHHAGGFVEQATLVGDTDSGPIETPFLLIATVRDGKIARLDEYFDSTIMRGVD